MEQAQEGPLGLHHLPHSVVAVILQHLLGSCDGGGGGGGAANSGGAKDLVHLAFSSKALLQAVAAAEPLWQQQCVRLGWSLDWLASLPVGTSSWQYFCRRMAVRHRLRGQLRTLSRFLDPLSAAAIRPAVTVQDIREVEAGLQVPLPWELSEVYRFCDGQAPERGGIQFLHEARLLTLQEMRQAVQGRYGPLTLAKAFAQLAQGSGGSGGGGSSSFAALAPASGGSGTPGAAQEGAGPSSSGGGLGCYPSSNAEAVGACASASTSGAHAGQQPLAATEPAVLLPFTDELRGRKVYCLDLGGRVWLSSGFNTLFVAHNLNALISRILT